MTHKRLKIAVFVLLFSGTVSFYALITGNSEISLKALDIVLAVSMVYIAGDSYRKS